MSAPASGYALLDFGAGRRLERWAGVVLDRPDARATGPRTLPPASWAEADAAFDGRIGGGRWQAAAPLPDRWPLTHAGLRFSVGCAPSGHTGLFPEQAAHWAWMVDLATAGIAVLNLFAYTGGASIALARAGARVTHVDASRPALVWARENAALNGVDTIRWIQEDARRFVDRERRRGRRYGGLLLDPPAFGRGPAGDWQLDRDLPGLLDAAVGLLEPEPAFVLVNVYTGNQDAGALERLLAWALDAGADVSIDADVLTLSDASGRLLPTGVYARMAPARATRKP